MPQVRLRMLLVLALVVCVGLVWVAAERRKIGDRNEAFRAMRAEYVEGTQPTWRFLLFGNDIYGYARTISFPRKVRIADADLTHFEGLTELRELELPGAQVTDAGLVHLQGLIELQWLDLTGTQVTDSGCHELLKSLRKCKILR